jgi:hypothetical protein
MVNIAGFRLAKTNFLADAQGADPPALSASKGVEIVQTSKIPPSHSNELTRGTTELVQHFRLWGCSNRRKSAVWHKI